MARRSPRAVHLQPAGVHALFLADHVLVEGVGGQTRPAAARGQGSVAGDQAQARLADGLERTRATIGSPSVWTIPAACVAAGGPGRDLGGCRPAERCRASGGLGCRGVVGKVLAEDSRCCCAVVDDDPANLDRDREPLPVVDVHQATDGATMTRTQEVFPLRGDRLQPCPVRPLLHGRGSLHEHVERGVAVPVLACVVGQGDRGVATDPIELLGQTQELVTVTVPASRSRSPNGAMGTTTTPRAGVTEAKPAAASPAMMASTSSSQ